MKFLDIVKEIQNLPENEGYLVLVRCGIFFDGIGKDGVILAEEFGINPICIKEKICKCAVSVKNIDRFIKSVTEKKISVAIYDYYPEGINGDINQKYELLTRIVLCPIEEYRKYLNCNNCWYQDRKIQSGKEMIDEAVERLKKMENINIIDIEDKRL